MINLVIKDFNKDATIKQSNALIIAKYKLTVNEQKLLVAIISQIDKNSPEFYKIRLKVADLAEFCNINSTNKYTQIRDTMVKLMSRLVVIPKKDGGEYITHWIQTSRYYPNESIIEYKIDDELKPELLQLKSAFFEHNAKIYMCLNSAYSIRMYDILSKMVKVGDFEYNLDFFRKIFQLNKTYNVFGNLKKRIIEPALAEINEKSDISIKHEYIKEGRNYTKIHFVIKSKAKKNIMPPSEHPVKREALDAESQDMLLRLINPDRWDLTEDIARKMIKKHGLERIEKNIQYAYQYRNGKENLGGWLISCIDRDEADKQKERAAIKRNEEDQAKKKAAERLESRGNVINSAEEKAAESEMEPVKEEISKFILDKILKSVLDKEPISALCQRELERHGLTVAEVMAEKL